MRNVGLMNICKHRQIFLFGFVKAEVLKWPGAGEGVCEEF